MLFSFGTILAISTALNNENINCHEKNSLNRSDGPDGLGGKRPSNEETIRRPHQSHENPGATIECGRLLQT